MRNGWFRKFNRFLAWLAFVRVSIRPLGYGWWGLVNDVVAEGDRDGGSKMQV